MKNTRTSQVLEECRKTLGSKLSSSERARTVKLIDALEALITRQGAQVQKGRVMIRQFLIELGMTPSSRSRVLKNPEQTASMSPEGSKLLTFKQRKEF